MLEAMREVLRNHLEKDEKVMHSLTKFCLDNNIQNGKISGIGAVKMTEIGAYDIVKKEYLRENKINGT